MAVCDSCPMRLFNTKHYNLQGVGNPYFGKCIVVPNVDYNAYKKGDMGFSTQVEIIKSSLSFTGELENLYILPLIRCNETISCELTDDIYFKCLTYFANDVKLYDFKDILLLGDAGRRFLQCDINKYMDTILLSKNFRRYSVNYSPLVKYTDEDKFKIFEAHLNKWYNSVITENYNGYEILQV